MPARQFQSNNVSRSYLVRREESGHINGISLVEDRIATENNKRKNGVYVRYVVVEGSS